MQILSDIYYGNICPCEKDPVQGSEYQKTQQQLADLTEKLNEQLNEEQRILVDDIMSCCSKLITLTGEENFTDGFKTGAKVILQIYDK